MCRDGRRQPLTRLPAFFSQQAGRRTGRKRWRAGGGSAGDETETGDEAAVAFNRRAGGEMRDVLAIPI